MQEPLYPACRLRICLDISNNQYINIYEKSKHLRNSGDGSVRDSFWRGPVQQWQQWARWSFCSRQHSAIGNSLPGRSSWFLESFLNVSPLGLKFRPFFSLTTGTNSSEINRNRLVVLWLPVGFSVPKSKVLHIIHYPDETLPDHDMKKWLHDNL